MRDSEQQIVNVTDIIKLDENTSQFIGVGSPEEIERKRIIAKQLADEERARRIAEVRKHKNKKARQAKQRANVILAELGLSKKERQTIGQRQRAAQIKKRENFRWEWTDSQQEV